MKFSCVPLFPIVGGYGATTPYAGTSADLVTEIEMVLYNGKRITASKTENEDIFWASQGGTGYVNLYNQLMITYNIQHTILTLLFLFFPRKGELVLLLVLYHVLLRIPVKRRSSLVLL